MDLTTVENRVESRVADSQILLVQSTFCPCRFTPQTRRQQIGIAALSNIIQPHLLGKDHFLTPEHGSHESTLSIS
jgi:hypothetical protein